MTDRPLPERLRRVREAGGDAVELWWPFASADPAADEVDALVRAVEDAGVALVGLNLFAGDMPAGDRGVLSWPGREAELDASARVAVRIAERLGTRRFNVLYGNRLEGHDAAEQDALAVRSLAALAPRFETFDGILMIEPVSGAAAYPVRTATQAADVVDRVAAHGGPTNLGVLLDLFHLATNGDDVGAAIETFGAVAAHVQVADAPGRGVPGTGDLPIRDWLRRLRSVGYTGRVALECTTDGDPFDHLDLHDWKDLA
ncbi:TIM barrel protein [Phycicoccus sp. BSK3Z-2]|uniref:TIM barrel protein n=2 Tax=Phycicoccus avicenniae TaxID=2828860 RepID=A0A941D703_9MICO|nr:TIM barrel protein [Phycicoccus avicenniae]